jgi:hypothetical protein
MRDLPMQVWQAKAEQDQAIRELAFSLRDMLAFANMAKDLKEIERGIDVIKEMSYAIQDGAKLITEYMNTSGWVSFVIGIVFVNVLELTVLMML